MERHLYKVTYNQWFDNMQDSDEPRSEEKFVVANSGEDAVKKIRRDSKTDIIEVGKKEYSMTKTEIEGLEYVSRVDLV